MTDFDFTFDGSYTFVEFTESFDRRFVGLDGRVYGPFDKGSCVRVPERQADVLRRHGVVK